MLGYNIDTVASLRAVDSSNLTNGLALLVIENASWYVFKAASTDSALGVDILVPDAAASASGRWHRCNNRNNVLNNVLEVTAIASTTINLTGTENVLVTLTADSTLLFSNIRNGRLTLTVRRNGATNDLVGWDARIRWASGSPYIYPGSFSATGTVIFTFIIIGTIIYQTNIKEYI